MKFEANFLQLIDVKEVLNVNSGFTINVNSYSISGDDGHFRDVWLAITRHKGFRVYVLERK